MEFAIIKNGTVVNVLVASQDFIEKWFPASGNDSVVLRHGSQGNIGQKYHDDKFYRVVEDREPSIPMKDSNGNPVVDIEGNPRMILGKGLGTFHEEEVL